MRNLFLLLAFAAVAACAQAPRIEWVSSTIEDPWQEMEVVHSGEVATESFSVNVADVKQTIEGFGTCFNELGWTSLSELSEADRAAILEDLFTPVGANFTLARMPLGANDFSVDFYSYDQVDGDFALGIPAQAFSQSLPSMLPAPSGVTCSVAPNANAGTAAKTAPANFAQNFLMSAPFA